MRYVVDMIKTLSIQRVIEANNQGDSIEKAQDYLESHSKEWLEEEAQIGYWEVCDSEKED